MVDNVQHIILVKSVKGGVGKSTVSTQLALSLWESGNRVGILDIDICGPSIPYLLNLENSSVYQSEDGKWVPIYKDESKRFAVMSIGFLLNSKDDPIIWRGPKKTSMIRQFVNDIEWGDLDYLIIDTPPGTSDEHITIMECMNDVTSKCDGALIITTPQEVSLEDVRKEITFCRKTQIKILGIIENMNGFTCPNCSECTPIFSSDGGKALAEYTKIPIWGSLPIDQRVSTVAKSFQSAIQALPESKFAVVFKDIIQNKLTKT